MLRIHLVDDHNMFRAGLKMILDETLDIRVVGEAGSIAEALELTANGEADVMVLDVQIGNENGLDIIRELKSLRPDLAILILSMNAEEQYALRAFKAGVSGYMTKNKAPHELVGAIQKIASGGRYISQSVAEVLAAEIDKGEVEVLHERLSSREYEVMCLLAAGKPVGEIGDSLDLAVSTVSTHRKRILAKMDLKNNAQLTYYAVKKGLVE